VSAPALNIAGWQRTIEQKQRRAGNFQLFQPGAGLYKKTIDLAGVYSSTRFSSDLLAATATAPNQNSCQIGLISNLN